MPEQPRNDGFFRTGRAFSHTFAAKFGKNPNLERLRWPFLVRELCLQVGNRLAQMAEEEDLEEPRGLPAGVDKEILKEAPDAWIW